MIMSSWTYLLKVQNVKVEDEVGLCEPKVNFIFNYKNTFQGRKVKLPLLFHRNVQTLCDNSDLGMALTSFMTLDTRHYEA